MKVHSLVVWVTDVFAFNVFSTGWCLIRLMTLEQRADKCCSGSSTSYALPVTQWSLFAVCMFFSTGHW